MTDEQVSETQQEEKPVQQETQNSEQEKETQKQESSGQYLLQHDRPNCIGCAACEAVAPDFWEMHEDGKSDIKGGKTRDDGWQELNFKEKNFDENKEAADSCPVNVIHITKKDTGEKII